MHTDESCLMVVKGSEGTPACGDIFCVRLLGVDATTAAKVCQLKVIIHNEDVFWLDVSMEDAIAMHVIQALHKLIHVTPDKVFSEVMTTASDKLVNVHVHQFKHESQATCRLVTATELQARHPPQHTVHISKTYMNANMNWACKKKYASLHVLLVLQAAKQLGLCMTCIMYTAGSTCSHR
jgi:hypothetical protein